MTISSHDDVAQERVVSSWSWRHRFVEHPGEQIKVFEDKGGAECSGDKGDTAVAAASKEDDDNDNDDDNDDDDADDFVDCAVAPPVRKRARTMARAPSPPPSPPPSQAGAAACALSLCPVCGKLADDLHIDGCIDAVCPPSPTMTDSGSDGGAAFPPARSCAAETVEHGVGPALCGHAEALRRAGVRTVADLFRIPRPVDEFLRFACGIEALGARKKLAARVHELQQSEFGSLDKLSEHGEKTGESRAANLPHPPLTPLLDPLRVGARNVKRNAPAATLTGTIKSVWDAFRTNNICTKRIAQDVTTTPRISAKPLPKRPPQARALSAVPGATSTRPAQKHSFAHRVSGTNFVVDSFKAAGSDSCTKYFLSHFHSDHYQNLRKSTLPSGAFVLCSAITASLVHSILRVPRDRIQILPSDGVSAVDVEDSTQGGGGATVRLFDANHCPGAVIILFYVWKTRRYVLHTGDFRFDLDMFSRYSFLTDIIAKRQLDFLHLDTTYADPRYSFPPQKDILSGVVEAARREDHRTRHRCLFFFGTYSIGKEKVFFAVAEALDLHIYADQRKRGILQQLGFGSRLDKRLVSDPGLARVHVISMASLSADGLKIYIKRSGLKRAFVGQGLAILFKPTGWSFRGSPNDGWHIGIRRSVRGRDQAVTFEVAYSEHSSFSELKAFIRWACPTRLIPTVNVKTASQADAMRMLLAHQDQPLRVICD